MSDGLKSLLFALVMCVVCSALLTAAATGLKRFQEKNIRLDMQKNILSVVGLVSKEKTYTPAVVERLYRENIKRQRVDADGNITPDTAEETDALPIYLYVRDAQLQSYIVPINTRGLWGKIHGYLALANDGATIMGFTVYKHLETPGLGGEIEKNWFQKNFAGKKIIDRQGDFVSIGIVKGKVSERVPSEKRINYVDGISGATLTGQFLAAGFREILYAYEPVSIRFRGNQMGRLPGTE